VGQLFAEKLCDYLGNSDLLLRFRSRDGAHCPMHRGARYIGYVRHHADAQARFIKSSTIRRRRAVSLRVPDIAFLGTIWATAA
jgi:hypothetical protein